MTAGGRRHDMIIVRFEDFLETHPRPATVSGGDMRGDWRGGAEHCGSPARSTWGGPIRFLFFAEDASCPSRTATAILDETVTRVATDHGFWELGRFSVRLPGIVWRISVGVLANASEDGPPRLEPPVFAWKSSLHH